MNTAFATEQLERHMPCSPEALFALLTDRAAREKWGAPTDTVVVIIDTFDLRPGGQETARCGPKESPDFNTISDFHVIEAPSRMVLTERLMVEGQDISVSLVTQEITPDGAGSKLVVNLLIASLVGPEMVEDYRSGWTGALDNLAAMVGRLN